MATWNKTYNRVEQYRPSEDVTITLTNRDFMPDWTVDITLASNDGEVVAKKSWTLIPDEELPGEWPVMREAAEVLALDWLDKLAELATNAANAVRNNTNQKGDDAK